MGMRDVRPNSRAASTSFLDAQLLLGLPSARPPRPAAKVMIARIDVGFRLPRAIAAQPPADWLTTMTLSGMINRHASCSR